MIDRVGDPLMSDSDSHQLYAHLPSPAPPHSILRTSSCRRHPCCTRSVGMTRVSYYERLTSRQVLQTRTGKEDGGKLDRRESAEDKTVVARLRVYCH